jgi:hypothetical protein
VAFVAAYSNTGYDYGLWFASSGGSPRLIARSGGQAPETPTGVVFTPTFQFLSPFNEIYLNGVGQIAFRANLSGPGVGPTNSVGIWLADPDGTVNLIARAGDTIAAGGVQRQLGMVTFGAVGVPVVGGPEDGRPVPLNDSGDLLFSAYFGSSGQGLFIAQQQALILTGQRSGPNFLVGFPTLAGKHYRVDFAQDLSATTTWSVLQSAVPGTGAAVTVTDTKAVSAQKRYYRVARTD